jgi:SpoVK/Ycf46/Vps4 family AAA+-type ATPase
MKMADPVEVKQAPAATLANEVVTEQQSIQEDIALTPALSEIVSLIRARIPLIYVTSHEETRFLEDFSTIVEKVFKGKRNLWVWSNTSGLVKGYHQNVRKVAEGAEEKSEVPRIALECILKHSPKTKNDPGDIYVMRDMHKVLTNDVPRVLRDMYDQLLNDKKTIIILAPYLGHGSMGDKRGIEPTLEKQITVVNFDLPSHEHMVKITKRAVQSLRRSEAVRKKAHLDYTDEEYREFTRALQGLTKQEIENVISTCMVHLKRIDAHRLLMEKKNIIRKSDILEYIDSTVTTKDVGGMDEAKSFFRNYKDAFSDEAQEYGVEPLRGVLLTGVPGTGKSLLAKGIADEWKLPLLRLDVGRVMTGLVGGSEQRMREAIQTAEAVAPCVLWIDEIEKALSGTGSSNFSDGGTLSRVFGTLLTGMQEGMKGITVVATANDISKLPPELIRRFNEVFFVDLPTDAERDEIFRIHLAKRKRDVKNFDIKALLKKSEGYTGAEIEKAVKDGLAIAWSDSHREIETKDLIQALSGTKPISKVMGEQIAKLQDWARNRARYASSKAAAKAAPGQQVVTTESGKQHDLKSVLDDMSEVVTSNKDSLQKQKEKGTVDPVVLDLE